MIELLLAHFVVLIGLVFIGYLISDEPVVDDIFSHPTTGYKGNRSEMDAYISNRERKLKG
jgi:hypothetical protein